MASAHFAFFAEDIEGLREKVSYLAWWIGMAPYWSQELHHIVELPTDLQLRYGRSMKALLRMQKACQDHGAGLAVILLANVGHIPLERGLPVIQLMEQFCLDQQIPCLNTYPAFVGLEQKLLWVHPLDCHPNAHACRILAEEIRGYIEQWDWEGSDSDL